MNKYFFLYLLISFVLFGCSAKKDLTELKEKYKQQSDDLVQTTEDYSQCLNTQEQATAKVSDLESQINYLKDVNYKLLESTGELATLSTKEAENLERSLESIKEKDLIINKLQDAITRKDSVTLALVTGIKRSLNDINDPDIEVNVEKGVVFISISDKLLFKSGRFKVSEQAKLVLEKVARIANDRPTIELMVEGHTDDVPVSLENILDNWDLSVKRATSVIRILQNDFNVDPKQLVAAGRSYYHPLLENTTKDNKAKNRRTKIVILPKLDDFYRIIEENLHGEK